MIYRESRTVLRRVRERAALRTGQTMPLTRAILLPLVLILAGALPIHARVSRTTTRAATPPVWRWVNPLPQGNPIRGIACAGAGACYAVGAYGTILVTRDAGVSWVPLQSSTRRDLLAIACPGPTSCYAAGAAGTILVTHDAGRTWSTHAAPPVDELARVSCPTERTCYVLGQDVSRACHVPGCTVQGQGNVLLVTRDGGATWRRRATGPVDYLTRIACPKGQWCILTATGGGVILVTEDGGRTWQQRGSLAREVYLQALTCPSVSVCYALGVTAVAHGANTGLYVTTRDRGLTWSSSAAIPPRAGVVEYGGIACPTIAVCYVTAYGGAVLLTRDSGRHWRTVVSPAGTDPGDVACSSVQACHVLGLASAILSTYDAGTTWRDSTRGPQDTLSAIACPGASTCRALAARGLLLTIHTARVGWHSTTMPLAASPGSPPGLACPTNSMCYAVGGGAALLRTQDGGQSWESLVNPFSGTSVAFAGIACPSATVCDAVGSGCVVSPCSGSDAHTVVLGTRDAGRAWRTLYDARVRDITAPGDVILRAIVCPSVTACYAVGSPGVILATDDGGRTWRKQTSPAVGTNADLRGAACPRATVCYVVGWGCPDSPGCALADFATTILATHDGGQTWARQQSHRTVAVFGPDCGSSGPCQTGVALNGIACPSATVCRAAGADGTILATEDGGRHWSVESTPTDNTLEGIACPGPAICLAVGEDGTILVLGQAEHPG